MKKRRKQKWESGEYVTHFPYTHNLFIVAAKYTNLFVCLYIFHAAYDEHPTKLKMKFQIETIIQTMEFALLQYMGERISFYRLEIFPQAQITLCWIQIQVGRIFGWRKTYRKNIFRTNSCDWMRNAITNMFEIVTAWLEISL